MFFSKNKFLNFQIFSTIFTWLLGTVLHFTYEWSNENSITAVFSAVNEEHMGAFKIVIFSNAHNYNYWVFLFKA